MKNFAKAGWDAIKSIGVGVKGGDSSKVAGGKSEFSCPGVEVLDTIRITPEEYDRRYGINATKHFTPEGETAPAFAPAVSGNLELGEDSVGLEIPNVMIPGQRTETTSQQITRREIEAYLAWLSEQRLSNDEFLNEMARHMRQLEEGGAHEQVLDQWKKQYEECVNAMTTDPVDISDYSAPYVEDEADDQHDAALDETAPAASGGGGEEVAFEEDEKDPKKDHTWYGDAREWLSEKLAFDISMPEGEGNVSPWIGSNAFIQLSLDDIIEDGRWSKMSDSDRKEYVRSIHEEWQRRMEHTLEIEWMLKAAEISGAVARIFGSGTTWVMEKLGVRKAVANDTGQFVTDVGEWIGFGYAGAILKEFKLVGKIVEGTPLKVFRKNVKITLANGETKIIKKIYKVEYCQIHHILSDKNDLILNHPLLKKSAFDLNDPVNKMLLPTVKGAEKSTTVRTLHQGCHLKEYSEKLAKKMDALHTEGQVAKWSQAQYRAKLEALISETRQQLKYGKIHLNKTTRESKGLPLAGE